jgi:hypothetical protein
MNEVLTSLTAEITEREVPIAVPFYVTGMVITDTVIAEVTEQEVPIAAPDGRPPRAGGAGGEEGVAGGGARAPQPRPLLPLGRAGGCRGRGGAE